MFEPVKNYLGEDCMIYTTDAHFSGVIQAMDGGWITVESNGNIDAVNLSYVTRIRKFEKPAPRSRRPKLL